MPALATSAIHKARRQRTSFLGAVKGPQQLVAIFLLDSQLATAHMQSVATTGSSAFMQIGELARLAGSNAETIRYYERVGLLPRPPRTSGNYRDYGPTHVDRLAFIRHARGLGFELDDVRALLRLADDPGGDCQEADRIATAHLAAVDAKLQRLQRLKSELQSMITQCRGGKVSSCRIIDALSDHEDCNSDHQVA